MLTILMLFVFTVVGLYMRKLGIISNPIKRLLYFYVYFIAVPAAIISSLLIQSNQNFEEYGLFILVNILASLGVFYLISAILQRHKYSHKRGGIVRFSSTTPNSVFLGFPLITILFSKSAFIYAVLLGSLVDSVLNTVRIASINQGDKKQSKYSSNKKILLVIKSILNPLSISLAIGITLALLPINLPSYLVEAAGYVGKTSAYVALLVLGVSLYGLKLRKTDKSTLASISVLKLLVMPAVVLAASLAFNLNEDARNVGVMIAALPAAVFSLIIGAHLKLDERLAASAILVTTVLSPFSLSLWYFLLQQL